MDDLLQLLQAEPSTHQAVGVYTHSNGDYFVILVQSGFIYSLELVLSGDGANLLSTYKSTYSTPSVRGSGVGTSGDQCKFEAYVLGQASGVGERVEIGTYSVSGSTLHYGWLFNWGGSEAVIVTQESVFSGTDLDHWVSRAYLLSVTEDLEGNLSASVVLSESVDWEPTIGRPHIWLPVFSAGGMQLWYPHACVGGLVEGYGDSAWKAPVHSFYKADGSRVTIYHQSEVLPENTIDDLTDEARAELCACLGWRHSYGDTEGEYIGRLGGYYHGFVTSEGDDWRGYETTGGIYHWKRILVESPSYTRSPAELPSLNPYTVTRWTDITQNYVTNIGLNPFNKARYEWKGGHVQFQQEYSGQDGSANGDNYQEHAISALLYPFHGSESAFIIEYTGKYRRLAYEGLGRTTITEVRQAHVYTSAPLRGWEYILFPIPSTGCGTLPDTNECKGNSTFTLEGANFSENAGIPEETYFYIEIDVITNIDLHLITPFETLDLDSIEEVTDGVASPEIGSYSEALFPLACATDPLLPKYKNLQSSFGNAIYTESGFDMSLGSNNSVAPPATTQDSLWVGRS